MNLRSFGRKAFLLWLAIEWVGVLFAYTFAVCILGFFIAWAVLMYQFQFVAILPACIALMASAFFMVYWAKKIPADLLQMAIRDRERRR